MPSAQIQQSQLQESHRPCTQARDDLSGSGPGFERLSHKNTKKTITTIDTCSSSFVNFGVQLVPAISGNLDASDSLSNRAFCLVN
jgi:hypothetical protein